MKFFAVFFAKICKFFVKIGNLGAFWGEMSVVCRLFSPEKGGCTRVFGCFRLADKPNLLSLYEFI